MLEEYYFPSEYSCYCLPFSIRRDFIATFKMPED